MDLHRLAEERSRALHHAIAVRLTADPRQVRTARDRVEEWGRGGRLSSYYVQRWIGLLDGPLETLLTVLVADTEDARALRQTTPFTGVVDPRTRWRIWSQVRERLERAS